MLLFWAITTFLYPEKGGQGKNRKGETAKLTLVIDCEEIVHFGGVARLPKFASKGIPARVGRSTFAEVNAGVLGEALLQRLRNIALIVI